MYVISSPWVIKLWEFSFPKLKIKTTPFSWFREFAFPIEKKSPFLAKWVRAWMYALVRTGGTAGTGTGSPIGGSPTKFEPNPSSLYRNAWELLDQWWGSSVVVVVVLHLPGSAGWLTPLGGAHAVLLRCLHFFLYSSVLLSSSVVFIMKLAAFFSSSTSSWKISLYSIVCPHLSLISGHVWSMCSWVSVSFLQNLHKRSFLHPFLKLFFTGSIDALVLIMAEHSFLFNFSIYNGLLPDVMSVLRSFQCFILVFFHVFIFYMVHEFGLYFFMEVFFKACFG